MVSEIEHIKHKLGSISDYDLEKKIVYISGDKFTRLVKNGTLRKSQYSGDYFLLGYEIRSYDSTPNLDPFTSKLRLLKDGESVSVDLSALSTGQARNKIGSMRVLVHKFSKKNNCRMKVKTNKKVVTITRLPICFSDKNDYNYTKEEET